MSINTTDSEIRPKLVMTELAFGESPRWHDGRLWVSDWGTHEIMAVDSTGHSDVMVRVDAPSFQPICMDWLPDGRLLIVSSTDGRLLISPSDGTRAVYADLSRLTDKGWNEIVADGRGNAYVNGGGFNLMAGEPFAPGIIALVTAGGEVRQVADGIAFPNGMAVTPDNTTLIIAESYANRLTAFDIAGDGSLSNRRLWADLGKDNPDGICIDMEGAVWYADVPHKHCARVREGGQILQTVSVDRGCFGCMLGGVAQPTLFIVAQEWHGTEGVQSTQRTGQVLSIPAPAWHAGWP